MMTTVSRALICGVMAVASASAMASPKARAYLKFEGAIGVDPLTGAGGVDVTNTVRGISPGGRAWVIRRFEATIYPDARVEMSGKGLLLSSGEVIATRAAVTHVAATLTCGAADATATKISTGPTELSPSGSFRFRGYLMDGANTAVLPSTCTNPQLLIRSANPTTGALGGWFAAGIVDADNDD